jgi:hypothetical protein
VNIYSESSAYVSNVNDEDHHKYKTNNDVRGISLYTNSTTYFPQNLGHFFQNLEFIHLKYGRVRKISQSDLKPHRRLRLIYLDENDIERIEKDLFKYNLDLEAIMLDNNKIFSIDSKVFDHLNKLTSLELYRNICIDKWSKNNRTGTEIIIDNVKNQCKSSSEFNEDSLSVRPCETENEYVELSCSFDTHDYSLIGTVYICWFSEATVFTRPSTYIYRIKGTHNLGKTYKDIRGLYSKTGGFSIFPMNLETFFPNLESININYGRLKEINQRNLMNFPNLKHLNLNFNDIEVIEIDLFAFNPQLKLIWFENNKLKSINEESLKNLIHLQDFYVEPCIDSYPRTHIDVTLALTQIPQKCPYSTNDALKVLKRREKSLTTQTECLIELTNNSKCDDVIFRVQRKILINKINDLKTTQIRIKEIEFLTNKTDEIEELRKNLEITKNSIKSLGDNTKNLESDLREKKSENEGNQQQLERAKIEINDLSKAKENLEKNLKNLKLENSKLSEELGDARNTIAGMEIEKGDIVSKNRDGNLGWRQKLINQHNQTLDALNHEKMINKLLVFVAVPLACLTTLISFAVCVSKCATKKEKRLAKDDEQNLEMNDVTNRTWMRESKNVLNLF